MADSNLTKDNVKTQRELGSIRDGSAANENMRPAKNPVDPAKVDGSKTPEAKAQKANYGVGEGQATAKANAAEEKVIRDSETKTVDGPDPVEVGRAQAKANLKK